MTCDHWSPEGVCGAQETRQYVTGHKCALHTPARLGGRPEPGGMYPATFPGAQEFRFNKSVTTRKQR